MERLTPQSLEGFARSVGRGVLRLFSTRQLASHGDHFVNDRHFVPFEQQLPLWDDMGCYYEGDLNAVQNTWPPYTPPNLGSPEAPNGWGQ